MSELIAGTYKIIGEIGAGGGGVVYLGEHTRLGKKVVLKADKRTLIEKVGKTVAEKPEAFRREVDALKNLSHTYIPQVYDFIEEDGVVYTVMDYIDGDSLDKPLKRGQRFTQAQIIEWACQLLEALDYLHSRPPHGILHADIKPANIMLTPQGDVRLIDFNIALALGEEGAVGVGRSFGYASPEHYGLDYSPNSETKEMQTGATTVITKEESAETVLEAATVIEPSPQLNSSSSTSGKKTIILNTRSDIYSLGATLYHIMTGTRPAQKADEVEPITDKGYSPAVTEIITKAMNPDQDLRYGSAEEMLHAFKNLREDDPRTKSFKRAVKLNIAALTVLFLLGAFTAFTGQRQLEQLQNALVLAEYSGNALRAGNTDSAINYALQALPERHGLFTPPNTAEAQLALTNALGVYDLSDGFKPYKTAELPSAPLYVQLSPDGGTAAVIYSGFVAVVDTETAGIIAELPSESSALAEVEFVHNSYIIFAGADGVTAYDITNNSVLWTGKPSTAVSVSADGSAVAAIYKDENSATVYNTMSGDILYEVDFGGKHQWVEANTLFANPNDSLFALNHDGSLLAVSFACGSLWIYDLHDPAEDIIITDETSGFTRFGGGFYGDYFAVSAWDGDYSFFSVIDVARLEQTMWVDGSRPFNVQTCETAGISLHTRNALVNVDPLTGAQTALVNIAEDIFNFARNDSHVLIAAESGFMFFDTHANLISRHENQGGSGFLQIAGGFALIADRDIPAIRILKHESNSHAEAFTYDPSYAHDEARISAEGTVMLYGYSGFRLYELHGGLITEAAFPNADNVHDPQFRRDGYGSPRLEVLYNDGTLLTYCAGTGDLLSETVVEKPDLTLYEEFFTDNFRIESPLHGTPAAYCINTGRLIRGLESDAYLTYVTQVGEYIITQYITADGYRYGLLLNSRLETLAVLPYLSDISEQNEILVFNYPTGNLRYSRIYSLTELIGLAREIQ
jgi:serine/threonine protein kinase